MGLTRNTIDGILTHIAIDVEKGFVNHPRDRGGPTKYGITIATLSAWRNKKATIDDVISLSLEEALAIYRYNYVAVPRFDRLNHVRVAEYAIDFGIHAGPMKAVRYLQTAAKVGVDGIIGPKTVAAVDADPDGVMRRFTRLRLVHYAQIVENNPSQAIFLEGWVIRATNWMEQ